MVLGRGGRFRPEESGQVSDVSEGLEPGSRFDDRFPPRCREDGGGQRVKLFHQFFPR